LAQQALGWIWASSDWTIPISGCKHGAEAQEIAGAPAFG
jgi:aryl-alcohol dehydrogenase-like predicted oxidoreductase